MNLITKKKLEELYIKKEYSPNEISLLLGCCRITIRNRLIKFNIKLRPTHYHTERMIKRMVKAKTLSGSYQQRSEAMKKNNPMRNPAVVKRVIQTSRKRGRYKEFAIRMQTKVIRNKTRIRMQKCNPMKQPEVARRMVRTKRRTGVYWPHPKHRRFYDKKTGKLRRILVNKLSPKEVKKRQSIAAKKLWRNKEFRKKIMTASINSDHSRTTLRMKNNNPMRNIRSKKKIIATLKKRYRDDVDFKNKHVAKIMKALQQRPTKPELIFMELVNKNQLPYKYVGDGKFILSGLNPDFINSNGKKEIIEIFGRYWHTEQDGRKRGAIFRGYGFRTLIIWDDELKDLDKVMKKVKAFNSKY